MKSFSFLVLVIVLAGCTSASDGWVRVPKVPAWIAPAGAQTYSALEVVTHCAVLAPGAPVDTSDATFTPLSHAWLEQAAEWSWHFAKAAGVSYTAESFDCDKFALGLAFAANLAASRAGVQAQPLLARIYVRQEVAFGGVAAGGGHALNAFLSDRGLFVLEPQSRKLVPLAEYPNRAVIFRIKLGG